MGHMIGDKFQYCGGGLRHYSRNWNAQRLTAADHADDGQEFFKRDVFTAENVALPSLPAFHDQHQTGADITHVDKVHDEIQVDLNTSAKKILQRQGRGREIPVVWSDRHRRISNNHGKAGRRSLQSMLFAQHFRARVGPGIWSSVTETSSARADAVHEGWKRMDSVEQCSKRETPRLRAAAITVAVPWALTA